MSSPTALSLPGTMRNKRHRGTFLGCFLVRTTCRQQRIQMDWWSNEEMDDQRLVKTILAWSDVHEW